MNNVPQKLKSNWALQDLQGIKRVCLRASEGDCKGHLTKEHAIIFAGKQLQMEWAILDICAFHHGVNEYQDTGKLDKEKHIWIALNRATDEELRAISKAVDYKQKREYLNNKYGVYKP